MTEPTFPVSVVRRTASGAVRGSSRWSPEAVLLLDRVATRAVIRAAVEAVKFARRDGRATVLAEHVADAFRAEEAETVTPDEVADLTAYNVRLEEWVRATHDAMRAAGLTPPPFPEGR